MTFSTYRSRRPGEIAPAWLTTPFSEPSVSAAPAEATEPHRSSRMPVPLLVFSAIAS